MTEILILSALFDVSLAVILLVYARRHYFIHKAMHARVTALMDFEPDSYGDKGYGSNSSGNQNNFKHRGISKFDA
jgi:hypothetical protein